MLFGAPIAALLSLAEPPAPVDLLTARLRRGDARAIAEAYDAHHEAVRAFARRLLGDLDAAEDVVHDVFVDLPKVISRFEGKSSLRTFLVSVAVNHARHAKRATARRLGAYERLHEEPRDVSETPEDDVARRRLAERLERMLAALPMDQRLVVVLCIVEERTSVEAAEILQIPEATVRTRLFYARKKLREMFDTEEQP